MPAEQMWHWANPTGRRLAVGWSSTGTEQLSTASTHPAVVLIHGFGANTDHWRHTMPALGRHTPTFALDLIGFGQSSQPCALLNREQNSPNANDDLHYSFDLWGEQVASFCREIVDRPVLLVGNSIGGVVALRAAQLLTNHPGGHPSGSRCCGVVLIDCAQRLMDDKQLAHQPAWMAWIRPLIKGLVSQRWLSSALFRNAARPSVIRSVLKQAYPSGANIDEALVDLLFQPTQRQGAAEAFRGFINLFDDHLAPDLLQDLSVPVDLIWGEKDPWEPLQEAERWVQRYAAVRSLSVIAEGGHCPHDEHPEQVNPLLLRCLTQQAT
ncbi:MAG: alpha/beta fold hydrolase [Synechococcus sp.]